MSPPPRHVVLWGPPGAGKTTVAERLAAALGWAFSDTDRLVERATGRSIADIFAAEGEDGFRAHERAIVRAALGAAEPTVIAAGGGALVDPHVRDEALARSLVVRLHAPVAVLRERLQAAGATRPLLAEPGALDALLRQRTRSYRSGHLAVDATGAPETIASQIAERVQTGFVPLHVAPHAYAAWLADEAAPRVLAQILAGLGPTSTHVVIDEAVHAAFGEGFLDALPIRPRSLHVVGPGEDAKRFSSLERVLAELIDAGIDREGVVVGLGGGATTDVAGFAAALVARGVRWVTVPTTLLAMVDAALGGKTAVNLRSVKNPVGVFHHPSAVVVDPSLAATEPDRGFRSAFAEIVKAALIGDRSLFERMERDPAAYAERRPAAIRDAVLASCRVKAAIVEADPDELGERKLLNLGHTVGHAIEAAAKGSLPHGEAIAMGLEAAMRIGVDLGITPEPVASRVVGLLRALGMPPLGDVPQDVIARMANDKKRHGPHVQIVLVRDVGTAVIEPVELARLQSTVRKLGPETSLP